MKTTGTRIKPSLLTLITISAGSYGVSKGKERPNARYNSLSLLFIAKILGILLTLFFFVKTSSFISSGQTCAQTFTTTTTFTVPVGITSLTVECWGGGGAGGAGTGNPACGGGGGGGAYARSEITVVSGNSYTVTVATAKSGNTTNSAAQNKGNPSWFETAATVYADGGNGGALASVNSTNGSGGAVSSGSIGTITYVGGSGSNGIYTSGVSGSAGGGGAGSNGTGGNAVTGTGGTGTTLNGGVGANGVGNSSNGAAGSTYGGGGSGGKANGITDRSGGTGAAGLVKVSWVFDQPSIITGNITPCVGSSQTYSVTNVSGLTYTWAFPAGWTITAGQGTNVVTATVGATAGNVQVTPSNACGSGTARTLAVTLSDVPASAGTITGNASVCTGSSHTYSVTNLAGVTYTWSFPAGWAITGGQGTNTVTVTAGAANGNVQVTPSNVCGNGSPNTLAVTAANGVAAQTDSITGVFYPCINTSQTYQVSNMTGVTYTWSGPTGSTITSGQGTNFVTILFGSNSGNITVVPSNICGNGPSMAQAITIQTSAPGQPSVINGIGAPCQGTAQSYNILNVPGVMLYSWTFPSDWTITYGQNTDSITVVVGSASGNISVYPVNTCGIGNPSVLAAFSMASIPANSGPILGTNAICLDNDQTYSVTNINNFVYTWTVPADWTINSGQGTNEIIVTAGIIPGNIKVTPSNNCGMGPVDSLAVAVDTTNPAQAGIINGDNNPCQTSIQIYSVSNIASVSYNWSLPIDWTIVSGQGSNTINVIVGTISGTVKVIASNSCGTAIAQTLDVFVSPLPGISGLIYGDTIFCAGASTIYSINQFNENSYLWSVPSGWTITDGQGTDSISVNIGINSGNVEVTPMNGCGNGTSGILHVDVNSIPAAETGIDKGICIGSSINIGAPPVAGSSYSWTSIPTGFVSNAANPGVQPDTTTTYYLVETIDATGCTNIDSVKITAVQAIIVTLTPSSLNMCTGSSTNIALTSNIFGTSFTWVAALTSGSGTTGFSNGAGASIAQILINGSDSNSHVTYSVTATANGCVNAETSIDVMIHPAPLVSVQTKTICSDIAVSLTLGASNNAVAVVSYNITNINANGLSAVAGNPVTGNGFSSSIITDDVWLNTTNASVNVIYTIVPVGSSCSGNPFTVTITVKPQPLITNSTPQLICSGTSTSINLSATIASTFSWTLGTITGGITGASAGSGASINQTLNNPDNVSPGFVPYIITPASIVGSCTGSAFTLTVIVKPSPIITNSSAKSICSGGTGTDISLTSSVASTFTWTTGTITGAITGASAGSGSIISQVLTNPSNTTAGSVQYNISATSSLGCNSTTPFTILVTVNPLPTATAGSSVNDVCPGIDFNLTSSSNIYFPTTLLSENFNGSNSWTKTNSSSGGTTANAAWTLRPNAYSSNSQTFHSNDNSQFYVSDSYFQNGTVTNTTLVSPAINTTGYSSLTLDFYHFYDYNAKTSESAKVQVSINGTVWSDIATYTSDQGSVNSFAHPSINLNAYVGNTTLYIRFNYYLGSNRGLYWAIDNVSLLGIPSAPAPTINWTSDPAGYNSNVANPASVVQTVTSTYYATYINSVTGCSNSASKTVNCYPSPIHTILARYCTIPGHIQLRDSIIDGTGTYLWSTTETTQIIAIDIAGVYSVTVTNSYGCSSPQYINAADELVVDATFTNFNPASPTFTTGYIQQQSYYNPSAPIPALTGLWPEGDYAVNTSAWYNSGAGAGYHPNFHGRDHTNNTSGPRNFLMINGSTTGNPLKIIWQQTVAVMPNTDYYFSGWAMNLNPVSPARLQFEVNGVLVGTIAELNIAPKPTSEGQVGLSNWVRFYSNPLWFSGSAIIAQIRIVNLNLIAGGNDFGLDDISFGTLAPIPFTIAPSSNSEICSGSSLNLLTNISGGRSPIVYTWTGPNGFISHLANPTIPNATVANSGNYTISVVDGYGCSPVVNIISAIVNPLPIGSVSGTSQVCQFAVQPNITFTGNVGTAPFAFLYNINGGSNQTITTTSGNSVSVSVSTLISGVYSYNLVSVSDAKGCSKNQAGSAIITVNSLPVCAISGPNPICAGATGIPYTATAGMSVYSWNIAGAGTIVGPTNTANLSVNAGPSYNTSFVLTLNITDSKGCSGVNSVEMFIRDVTNPTLTVPSTQTRFANLNICTYTAVGNEFNPVSYGDNCQVFSVLNNLNGTNDLAGYVFSLGTTPATWTVTDVAGNSFSRIFNVVVRDNQSPLITCPSSQVVCPNNSNTYIHGTNLWNATATDNCSLASITYTLSGVTSGSGSTLNGVAFNTGTTNVTWTATDASGNSSNCTFTVTVQTHPIITLQPHDATVCPFTTQAVFSVTASLTPPPSYQWRKDEINIIGENNSTYTINNPQPSDEGDYDVVITNSCGSITSSVANLIFPDPLYAAHDTVFVSTSLGYDPDVLSLLNSETGGAAPFTYQWQLNNVDIPLANGTSYDPPPLNVAGTYIYRCKISDACGTLFITKVKIITIEMPLPISLAYFSGECDNGIVECNWSTITETNNDYFTLENSLDVENWSEVARIDGAGNSNAVLYYQYLDNKGPGGISYYRLKQTDFDGKYEIFSPVSVICESEKQNRISIYPNPFAEALIIQYADLDEGKARVKVYDMMGHMVSDREFAVNFGNNNYLLELNNLAVGLYNIEFTSGDMNYHQRVLKE